ncbi:MULTISPECIES: hypothetical protein [unclassified Providencia]|uniref:hypothetical protein n=1 Tax=unclassified Providencia TaxID=2633465 RepID=UPI00234AE948|nr:MULTISPECIES: hypothetical protein [unclassified Providencia]
MNENENKSENYVNEVIAHEVKSQDVYLDIANKWANMKTSVGMDVTLIMKGCIVTGSIISGKLWAEKQSANLKRTETDEDKQLVRDAIADSIQSLGDSLYASENESSPHSFMHLTNANILSPSGHSLGIKADMRIKLGEVDGFFFGNTKKS